MDFKELRGKWGKLPGLFFPFVIIGVLLMPSYCQAFAQASASAGHTASLTVQSRQDSVAVYCDSTFEGFVPKHMIVSCDTPVVIRFARKGFLTLRDTVRLHSYSDTTLLISLQRAATLIISSTPANANVYVDDKCVGVSPDTLTGLSTDTVHIAAWKAYCEPWSASIVPRAGSVTEITANLRHRATILNVFANRRNASIFLDSRLVSRGSLFDCEIGSGAHELRVRDNSSGRNAVLEFNAIEGQPLNLDAKLGVISPSRVILALLVPGSAQLLDGDYTRGGIMLLGSIALGVNMAMAQDEYLDRVYQYDVAWQNYANATTEVDAARLHDEVVSRKSDLNSYYARRTVSIAVFAAAYAYTVIDALLNHLKVNVIEVAPLATPQSAGAPSLSDAGVEVRVKL